MAPSTLDEWGVMGWEKKLFREKDEVWVRCDANGVPKKVAGPLVEMRYSEGGKTYRANSKNISPLPGEASSKAEEFENVEPSDGEVIAYTDGACSGNPGPAGLGVVLRWGEESKEISEYLGKGTNNIAELTAILRAAQEIEALGMTGVIHTDSSYSIGVLTKGWKAKANRQLVADTKKALAALSKVRLVKVPGHSGVPDNELADQLAVSAIENR